MADPLSVAASIAGIATAGIQVSIKIVTLAGQVSTASERISAIGNDISLTAGILHQLGELTNQKSTNGDHFVFNKEGLETTKTSAQVCRRIFEEVERETAKASDSIRGKHRVGRQVKLSMFERAKWPFLQPGIELLRKDLREAKGTLMLMLQVASLALSSQMSKQLANVNPSSLVGAENEDRIHSIYILQQQQQVKHVQARGLGSASGCKEDRVAHQASKDVGDDEVLSVAPDLVAKPLISNSEEEVIVERNGKPKKSKRGKRSLQSESGEFSLSDEDFTPTNSQTPKTRSVVDTNDSKMAQESLLGVQGSHDHTPNDNPKGKAGAKELKLHGCSFDPFVAAEPARVKIEWFRSDLQVSEGEIRERLTKKQNHEHSSVSDILETLHPYERQLVSAELESVRYGHFCDEVTLLDLRRTEHDLRQGNMTIKAVPSFHFIVQLENPSPSQWYDGRKVMGLNQPTYIKSHVDHVSPECLDAYKLPWEYDKKNPGYVIIKRWIPEGDQNILFEYTRRLRKEKELKYTIPAKRERKKASDTALALKKERDQLLLVRKKSPGPKRERSQRRRRQDWADDTPRSRSSSSKERGRWTALHKPPYVEDEDEESSEEDKDEDTDEDAGDGLFSTEDEVPDAELDAVNQLLRKYTTIFE